MIRVLQIVTYMGLGGLETMIMNYYRNIDRTKIQFDFLVHRYEELIMIKTFILRRTYLSYAYAESVF